MFDKLRRLAKKAKEKDKKTLLHIALTVDGTKEWCEINQKPLSAGYDKTFSVLNSIIKRQVLEDIRVFSIYVLPQFKSKTGLMLSCLSDFLKDPINKKHFNDNQVKVSFIGKWYDLPDNLVEDIKDIIEDTKDYDKFFLNLCLNYDGQEEIVDACKLIAKKVISGRLDPGSIDASAIKDNIYSSYFMPPDIIIKTGPAVHLSGFLLWDSAYSKIFFSEKLFPDYSAKRFVKDIRDAVYQQDTFSINNSGKI